MITPIKHEPKNLGRQNRIKNQKKKFTENYALKTFQKQKLHIKK